MKIYPKEKFHFLNDDGSIKEPQENDYYYATETKLTRSFPFLHMNTIVSYKLIDGYWIDQKYMGTAEFK